MDRYSLIVVSGETDPIRRFDVKKTDLRRWLQIAGVVVAVFVIGMVDYVHVRIQHSELARLRAETAEQRARIASFDETVAGVQATLDRVRELERKVRIIANLPGSAAAGGDEVIEADPEADLSGLAGGGIDVEAVPTSPAPDGRSAARRAARQSTAERAEDDVSWLRREVRRLTFVAEQRHLSLEELVTGLEDKHDRLASSPAVWPAKGWLTSRFGMRVSPFTGRRQFHAGIDVAGAPGSPVIATARGRVVFAGPKGPMGQTVIIDHGHGVETHYGHNQELRVKRGQQVERGDVIANLGNTGRSTGPHLHYTVEVNGKAVNPLDYIFD
jgi:murein DD-endopeptidase MepM/ murein hydrolase activator NlpD